MRSPTITFLACAIAAAISTAACGSSEGLESAAEARALLRVAVAPVLGQDEAITIEATGGFEAAEASDLAPSASGLVVATPVNVGDFVTVGQVLVRLQGVDAGFRLDEAHAAVRRAQATVKLTESQNALAQATAERSIALLTRGLVARTEADLATTQAEASRQSVHTASASLAESQARLAQAKKDVADVVVSAPFAGHVSARHVSLGEYVQPSTPVLTLLQVNPLRLHLTIPGVQASQVSRGQTVEARVDAYPGQVFAGEIGAVNPAVSPESRSLVVEALVPNPQALLKPGMFAVATIDQGRTRRAVFVPRPAVIEDVNTNSFRVFVIDPQNRARLRVVQLAARQPDDRVQIVNGIAEGERVAMSNLGDLYDGAAVEIGDTAS